MTREELLTEAEKALADCRCSPLPSAQIALAKTYIILADAQGKADRAAAKAKPLFSIGRPLECISYPSHSMGIYPDVFDVVLAVMATAIGVAIGFLIWGLA